MVHAVPLSTTITPATYLGEPIEQFVSALGLGGMLVALLMGRAYTRRRSNKKR
jgi:hypothetical protein